MQSFFILVSALLCLVLAPLSLAKQPSPEQLEALKENIRELQENMADTVEDRSDAQAALHDIANRIAALSKKQQQLEQQQQKNRAHYTKLQQQQKQLIRQKKTQVQALTQLLRQRYLTGGEARLKLLLNQQDPALIARQLQYQKYIGKAASQRIKALADSLKQLQAVSEQLLAAKRQIQKNQHKLDVQQRKMQQARDERQTLIAKLDQKYSSQQQQLKQLKADRERLEKLLADMHQLIQDIPANLGGIPFSQLDHRLPWPLRGELVVHFHSRRSASSRWGGVIIKGKRGDPVRAIYPGRVIYADWLPGYGLLTIIDQGQGYMTLYGFNRDLTRRVGDWVEAGDIIAHVGQSGGHRQPGLYFAIRHNGRPVNPSHWCNARVTLGTL